MSAVTAASKMVCGLPREKRTRILLILFLIGAINESADGQCDAVNKEELVCSPDNMTISCAPEEILLIQSSSIALTNSTDCDISNLCEYVNIGDVLRDTCDYQQSCHLVSEDIIQSEAPSSNCSKSAAVHVDYVCIEESGPNDTGYLQIDVCEDRSHQDMTTYGLLAAESLDGSDCGCSFQPLDGKQLVFHVRPNITTTNDNCYDFLIADEVKHLKTNHDRSTSYHLNCTSDVPQSAVQIVFRDISDRCLVDLSFKLEDDQDVIQVQCGPVEPVPEEKEDEFPIAIVAGVVGGVIALLVIIIIILVVAKRNRGEEDSPDRTRAATSHSSRNAPPGERVYHVDLDMSYSPNRSTEDMVVVTHPQGLYHQN